LIRKYMTDKDNNFHGATLNIIFKDH